jgi:hypothetical protein
LGHRGAVQAGGDAGQLVAAFVVQDGDDGVLAGNGGIGRPGGFGQEKLAGFLNCFPVGGVFAELLAAEVVELEDDFTDGVSVCQRGQAVGRPGR